MVFQDVALPFEVRPDPIFVEIYSPSPGMRVLAIEFEEAAARGYSKKKARVIRDVSSA